MTGTLLNIAATIDPLTVELLDAVDRATALLGMPYVIVGATARDLMLHHAHGIRIARATRDVDFGIEVPTWTAFAALREQLCALGFRSSGTTHRLTGPADIPVDIVPFGGVADEGATIGWPPEGAIVMNVLGFADACAAAQRVRIRDQPALDVPVATPAGLILLKLIAWSDPARGAGRRRDAIDVAYVLAHYHQLADIRTALYGDCAGVLENYDWDLTIAGAYLLGVHSRHIAQLPTQQHVIRLGDAGPDGTALDRLAEAMSDRYEPDRAARNRQLLSAFMEGFAP